jgi:hypothetical protein
MFSVKQIEEKGTRLDIQQKGFMATYTNALGA